MKKQFMSFITTLFLLFLLTACQSTSPHTKQVAPSLCSEFQMDDKIPLRVHIPKSGEVAYVGMTPTTSFEGSIATLPLEIYRMTQTKDGYCSPEAFTLPEGFTYSTAFTVSPDGKKMFLSAQNADFFGNDSINILVGDIEGTTLTNLTPLDSLNTSTDQFVMSVDDAQNLLYLSPVGEHYSQVFYSHYENNNYTPGILLPEAINGEGYQSIGACLTPDGNRLINTQQIYQNTPYPGLLLSSSLDKEGNWVQSTAFDLNINDLNTMSLLPSISGDGKTLYYLSMPFDEHTMIPDMSNSHIYKVNLNEALNTLLSTEQKAPDHTFDTSNFSLALRHKGDESQKQGVYYELFVRAFADSDGDGIGDFNGITNKLDYLQELGIDGIWLMPINASPSYHGYDVIDYSKLNSDYGTEDDFKRLLDEAHKRNIKIIMDFVINHTSNQHPWFKSAIFSENSPYRDYYRIVNPSDTENYVEGASSPWNSSVWHPFGNLYYYGIFTDSMPDLNYNNPKVREEIKSAAAKWLEMGVDGFRLDAALHIYGVHEFEKQEDFTKSNIQWWNEFATACEAINPNVYLVGEAWDSDNPLADYVQPFDTKFNFTLQSDMLYAVKNGLSFTAHGEDLATSLKTLLDTYQNVDSKYLDGIFASNHDQDRIMSAVVVEDKARILPHIYLTLPGNPYIYYGEELGMKGKKPDELIRLDFKWTDDPNTLPNCNWAAAYGNDFSSENLDTPSLETQMKDSDSMYQLYKTLIAFRKNHPAILSGDYEPIATKNTSVLGYRRFTNEENLIILHNLSSKETTITLNELKESTCLYSSHPENNLVGDTLTLPGYSTVIYQMP